MADKSPNFKRILHTRSLTHLEEMAPKDFAEILAKERAQKEEEMYNFSPDK